MPSSNQRKFPSQSFDMKTNLYPYADTLAVSERELNAATPCHARVLTLPNANDQTLSIRAKAMVFNDPKSIDLCRHVELIAPSGANVLIVGETGTGKELIARHTHAQSGRRGPFLAVNCGAFNENLVESELFGHEAGAFTGAQQARAGWFEAANGGTLFLDEVGDLPQSVQVKLLRVLQERQVVRLGSRKPIALDVRLIAGTNVDLEKAVQAKHFRLDLFYRLNVAPVFIPALRERPGDILPLVAYFIEYYGQKLNTPPPRLTHEAAKLLELYQWPGNIRELENVIHFALIICQNDEILPGDLRLPNMGEQLTKLSAGTTDHSAQASVTASLGIHFGRFLEAGVPNLLEEIERAIFTTAFEYCRENQVRTAKELGISRNVLRSQLKRFGLIGETAPAESEA